MNNPGGSRFDSCMYENLHPPVVPMYLPEARKTILVKVLKVWPDDHRDVEGLNGTKYLGVPSDWFEDTTLERGE